MNFVSASQWITIDLILDVFFIDFIYIFTVVMDFDVLFKL